ARKKIAALHRIQELRRPEEWRSNGDQSIHIVVGGVVQYVATRENTAHAVGEDVNLCAGMQLPYALDKTLQFLRGRAKVLSPVVDELKKIGVYLARITVLGMIAGVGIPVKLLLNIPASRRQKI